MGKPRFIETGDGTAGARVEYIKSRRIFRLGGWHGGDRDIAPVEVPTGRFLDKLGIDPAELGAVPIFVLMAGLRDRPGGAIRHAVTAYPSELEARHQFGLIRARHQQAGEWARLMTVDARCAVVPLCWFGEGVVDTAVSAPEASAVRRRWTSRRRSRSG